MSLNYVHNTSIKYLYYSHQLLKVDENPKIIADKYVNYFMHEKVERNLINI